MDFVDFTSMEDMPVPLKEPIQISSLASNKRVIFEIDANQLSQELWEDDVEEDDVAAGEVPFSEASDPRAYARRAREPFLYGYTARLEKAFASFQDAEVVQGMEVVEGTNGGVRKSVVKEGCGVVIPENSKVFIHYVLTCQGLEEPFDSTVQRGYPLTVDLRNANLLVGLYFGLIGMRVGEVAKFWIRHEYGFGEFGCLPRIPKRAELWAVVEVMDLIEEDQLKQIPMMSAEERGTLEFTDILKAATELKEKGNGDYIAGAYRSAVRRYAKGVQLLEEYGTRTEEEHRQRQDMLYHLYMNVSACCVKTEFWPKVCIACKAAKAAAESIGRQVDAKLFYRFAKAKLNLGDPEAAKGLNAEALLRMPKEETILQQKKDILYAVQLAKKQSTFCMERMGNALASGKISEQTNSSTAERNGKTNAMDSKLQNVHIKEKSDTELFPSVEWEDMAEKIGMD